MLGAKIFSKYVCMLGKDDCDDNGGGGGGGGGGDSDI
jgi:hypothetical protein